MAVFPQRKSENPGFTLLELMLVVAGITILIAATIFALNPGRQLAEARNSQRQVDVNVILNAVHQYSLDNNGQFPTAIPTESDCATASGNEVCQTGAPSCSGFADMSVLTTNEKYLVDLPVDPKAATSSNGAGYRISKSSNGRVSVCAPLAEEGDTIQVTR